MDPGEAASLQTLLEVPGSDRSPSLAFFRDLDDAKRFHRDSGFGRIFHPGRASFRENRATDSLHVVIGGNHVSAHVDLVSPLRLGWHQRARYSLRMMAAHNLAGMAQDLVRLLRGRQGDHRSHIDCEWVWEWLADPPKATPAVDDLLDREAALWSVQVEAQVGGGLDERRLRDAMAAVLGPRPFDHDPLRVVECANEAALQSARTQLQRQPVGMTEWPPLRAALAHHPDGDLVMLNVNHAASDGFDTVKVLSTIAAAYATGAGPGKPLDFGAADPLPVRPAAEPVSRATAWYRTTEERVRNLLAPPARLAPDGGGTDDAIGFRLVCLTVAETDAIVNVDRPGTTRNVLLAGLHLAVSTWNREHGTAAHRIGVLVPVDLRPPGWAAERVGNFSVTARVSTSHRHRAHGAAALRAVTSQTTRNKRTRTGIALLAGLERAGLLPLWSKQSLIVLQPLTRNRLVDTALLANVGWLAMPAFGDDAGETRHVWFSSPARGPRTLCIGAVIVGGRLHLVVRYPERLFDADAARRFADCFVAEVAAVAAQRGR